jgi:hypothetical protein
MKGGVAQLVEAVRYKPEGSGFDYRCVIENVNSHNRSGRTIVLELAQLLIEMRTRTLSWP